VQPVDRIHEWQHFAPIAAAVVHIIHSHAATQPLFATHDLDRLFRRQKSLSLQSQP
jgi:DNA mismatch repair ATPase MutS